MRLIRLSLANFRNYIELEIEPSAGLNVFVGANAQGKSNLLEAIAMLGTGKSFRTANEGDVIRNGMQLATITGDAEVRAGVVRLSCTVSTTARGTRKLYGINGQGVQYASFLGRARVVTFIPADLHLVSGSPAGRRGMLNTALAQEQPLYYRELARYRKTLQQKNALLRSESIDDDLLAIYNRTLIDSGTALMLARNHFTMALADAARNVHAMWSGGTESLEIRYAPNVAFELPTADAIVAAFSDRLRERAEAERVRKASLVGPHRDDLHLNVNGIALSAYGSQGQQRTAVLALKVAEYTVMRERSGEAPLLLLDDVFSELDAARARAFLDEIGTFEQVFVTTTQVPAHFDVARVWNVDHATLVEAA